MTITPASLTRAAGAAAVAAGLIFIGVQINHPYLDAGSVDTTEVVVRDSLKVLMCVLALVGITGMYLRQVRQIGLLGLVGYVLYALCYLGILCTSFVAAYVLPSIARTDPAFVDDVTAEATNRHAVGDIGLLDQAILLQGIGYLLGGLIFGIALYRAGVLARWAAALLAVSGVVSVALSFMPDAFYRFLAFPNGLAMIGLGWSLWMSTRSIGPDEVISTGSTGGDAALRTSAGGLNARA
jgi:hypothetical protein